MGRVAPVGSDRVLHRWLKALVCAASLSPVAYLIWAAFTHHLSIDPFPRITRNTGFWALRFLCLTLAITPLRWLTGWQPVSQYRRLLGLFAFFYATLHGLAYVVFYKFAGLDFPDGMLSATTAVQLATAVGADIVRRPLISTGFAAFALMVPLAATSTVGMIRRLGGPRWRALHQLVYAAAILSVVHYRWPLRPGLPRYGVIIGALLAVRIGRSWVRRTRPALALPLPSGVPKVE